MKKSVSKKAVKICLICLLLFTAVVYFLYSVKYPVTSKIKCIRITTFTEDDKDNVSFVKNNLKSEQIFYNEDAVLSDNASEYVFVAYECKVKINCLSSVGLIYCIVNNVPENDAAFISAQRMDFPMQTAMYIPTDTASYILMNRKGLTDEELYEKIKSVKLDVIYKHKGEAGEVEVKGIDSLDFDDIVWRKK